MFLVDIPVSCCLAYVSTASLLANVVDYTQIDQIHQDDAYVYILQIEHNYYLLAIHLLLSMLVLRLSEDLKVITSFFHPENILVLVVVSKQSEMQ